MEDGMEKGGNGQHPLDRRHTGSKSKNGGLPNDRHFMSTVHRGVDRELFKEVEEKRGRLSLEGLVLRANQIRDHRLRQQALYGILFEQIKELKRIKSDIEGKTDRQARSLNEWLERTAGKVKDIISTMHEDRYMEALYSALIGTGISTD